MAEEPDGGRSGRWEVGGGDHRGKECVQEAGRGPGCGELVEHGEAQAVEAGG